jgi:hypothetical protein
MGGAVTVMAVPRMMMAGVDLAVYIPACLTTLILVSGAATAWNRHGGLHGLWPGGRRGRFGVAAGLVSALVMLPFAFALDRLRWELLEAGRLEHWTVMPPPTLPMEIIALVLWRAGFEVAFFHAGAICFFSRLFHDWRPALFGAILLRGLVTYLQMGGDLTSDHAPVFLAFILIDAAIASGLFIAAGWPAVSAYVIVLGLRHFWS